MSTKTNQVSSDVHDAIDRACARNAPAELHYSANNETHIARIRLIKIEGNEIYADAPLSSDSKTALSKHQPVIIHTMIDNTRYAFQTRVERVFTMVDLNAKKRIRAITFAIPRQIKQQQRREYYRVSVAGHDDIRIDFCPTLPDRSDCCSIDAKHFSGRLVNISTGGLLVIVPVSQHRGFRFGERFFVEFELPDIEDPFQLSVEMRHFRKVHENTDTLVGLKFKTDVNWPVRPLVQQITRFIANEERRQLRRGRL